MNKIHLICIAISIINSVQLFDAQNTYILSRDCRTPLHQDLLLYSRTKYLQIDNLKNGIVLLSHDGFMENTTSAAASSYPEDFSCELVVHTPVENARIMMQIEKFYVPSQTKDCVENYLYVFDSNTAKSKAMPEAGGERGLCGMSYPRQPIFTSKSYICLAFHTSSLRLPQLSHRPGFRLILTAVQETKSNACPAGSFYCGLIPQQFPSSSTEDKHLYGLDNRVYNSNPLSFKEVALSTTDAKFRTFPSDKHFLGYCILDGCVCDGIRNCADGLDEDPSRCDAIKGNNGFYLDSSNSVNWLSGFLALGVPASIAIAVSTIVIFTIGIGAAICCCHRCCQSGRLYNRPIDVCNSRTMMLLYPFTTGTNMGPEYNGTNRNLADINQLGLSQHSNLALMMNRNHPSGGGGGGGYPSHDPSLMHTDSTLSAYPQYYPYVAVSNPSLGQNIVSSQLLGTKHQSVRSWQINANPTNLTMASHGQLKADLLDNQTRLSNQQLKGAVSLLSAPVNHLGSDSYSSVNTDSIRGCYQPQSLPPGPPPALIHGLLGSPYIYRRDPVCYTPPPYGACNVPPASSVTASSSHTGTSGGPQEICLNALCNKPDPLVGQINPGNESNHVNGSNTELFAQQMSGAGSALHTNTPVETNSQGGGDLPSSLGGIVYLGELFPSSSPDSPHFERPCGPSSVTTESESSRDPNAYPKLRRHLQERHKLHAPVNSPSRGSRQSKQSSDESGVAASSSRHSKTRSRRHRHHRSIDPTGRTISSGSHTPASSRSGVRTSVKQRSLNPHDPTSFNKPVSSEQQPVTYPVHL